jgi:hypothetical protein
MRMMFTSPRLENVEAVQAMLQEAGIQSKIVGGRSYKAFSRRGFSYNAKTPYGMESPPQLWVIRADDYRKAREILLSQNLLEEKRESFAPQSNREAAGTDPSRKLSKIRIVLLMGVMTVMAIQAIRLMISNG